MPHHFTTIKFSARLLGLSLLLLCGGSFAQLSFSSRSTPNVRLNAASVSPSSALFVVAPQAEANTIRQLQLVTNDLVYNPTTQLIYASVPSGAGVGGNSITSINPMLSAVGASIFVGSEPDKMALSDNGQYIYVGLNGAGAVRRFDVAAQTPDRFFYLGSNSFSGPYQARDIAVMPGNPGTVAVSRSLPGNTPDFAGVAIFDEGVQRPVVAGLDSTRAGSSYIEFSSSPATIYGSGDNRLQHINVTSSGLVISRSAQLPSGNFKFDAGLLYTPSGQVIDPEAEQVVGTYDLQNSSPYLVVPDPDADRVYFIVDRNGSYELRVYEKHSFQLAGTLTIGPYVTFNISSLIRWGASGLAFRAGDKVILIQTPLVPTSGTYPSPPPSPTTTPSPTPVPTPGPGEMRVVPLNINDIVVDPRTQTLYASVTSGTGVADNSITAVNPVTGAIGTSVSVGPGANKMTVSDDGRVIYVGLDGVSAVRRYDVDTQTPGVQFDISASNSTPRWRALDLAVVPGHPESVVVARGTDCCNGGLDAIYDNGVQRSATDTFNGADVIEFSSNPSVLYGYNNEISTRTFNRMVVASCGVGTASARRGLINGFIDFKLDNGRIYASSGQVIDPETQTRLGTFPAPGAFFVNGPVAPDSKAGRTYYVTQSSTTGLLTLRAYDQQTFLEVGSLDLPGVSGTPASLVRWGMNGVAFRTINNQGAGDKLIIIQTPLIATPSLTPALAPPPATPTLGLLGSVTDFSNAVGGVTMMLSGSQSATVTTDASGKYSFDNLAPCGDYTVTPSAPFTTFNPTVQTFSSLLGFKTADFNASVRRFSLFGQTTVSESARRFVISVLRSGDSSGPATLDYATYDGTASERTDYTAAVGTLRFAPGETFKPIFIFVTDDTLVESPETLTLTFSNPTGALPLPSNSVTLTINSNDIVDGPNPVSDASFDPQFFVRQHYIDFLGREPDAAGLAFWAGQTTACGSTDPTVCRINASAAFFLSIEFQETGYLVYKTYGAAFGTRRVGGSVPLTLREFLPDTQSIATGVVVNQGNWQARLEANKQAYFGEFVSRPAFIAQYPTNISAAQFVDSVNSNAGGALTQESRDSLVARLGAVQITRGQALREIAENAVFSAREKNRAFVLMQYFGYLRRNPNDTPETNLDFSGYNFWLSKLDGFNGNFIQAEMVKAFISSDEYRKRFGP